MCHLQGALGGHHLVICRGFAEGKMSSALGRMVPLQGCGRQAPQCQELAGDSSRTCCCPAKVWLDNFFGQKEGKDHPGTLHPFGTPKAKFGYFYKVKLKKIRSLEI